MDGTQRGDRNENVKKQRRERKIPHNRRKRGKDTIKQTIEKFGKCHRYSWLIRKGSLEKKGKHYFGRGLCTTRDEKRGVTNGGRDLGKLGSEKTRGGCGGGGEQREGE